MKSIYTFFFILLFSSSISAQINRDSLLEIWANTSLADTTRLKSIQKLAVFFINSHPDSSLFFANLELKYSVKVNNKKWQSKALNVIGNVFIMKSEYKKAFDYFQKCLVLAIELNDKKGIAAVYNNMGLINGNLGNYIAAIKYYQMTLSIDEELKEEKNIAGSYLNIGTVYSSLENFDKAIDYFNKSLKINERLDNKPSIALAYSNIGSALSNQNKIQQAIEYLQKSIFIRERLNDKQGLATSFNTMGHICMKEAKYKEALTYYNKSIQLQQELGDKQGISFTSIQIGELFNQQKKALKAIPWCSKGLKESKLVGSISTQRNSCDCLYKSYKQLGNTKEALNFHEQFLSLTDSLRREESNKKLEQFEFSKWMTSDSLAKKEEIHKLELAHEKELSKKNATRDILLLIGLIILILSIGLWSRLIYFRKQSQLLEDKTESLEKQQLLNEVALLKTQVNPHFLFNSLSILSSLVGLDPDLSEKFIDQLSRSYRYILEHQDHSLVKLKTELEFINSYSFLLKIRFENKFDIQFDLTEDDLENFKIAPLTLQLLIENAVKHNRMSIKEPLIIEVQVEKNMLIVKNRLQKRSSESYSSGMGLQNIKNRYALLTSKPVWAGEHDGTFMVKVPLL